MRNIFALSLVFFNVSAFAMGDADFTFHHQPINPACLAIFNDILAAQPYVLSISLDQCENSEGISQARLKDSQGGYYFYHNNIDAKAGMYGYQLMGKTKNIYVVKTYTNGGGSGTFTEILLLAMQPTKISHVTNGNLVADNITQLVLKGYIMGGDRCFGDFADIHLSNDILTIKQYNNNVAVNCSKTRSYSVDLSSL